jgi:hypothetical protein
MKSLLLPLAVCAALGGCAAYPAPYGYGGYGYGYGYPAAAGYYGSYGWDEPVIIDGRRGWRHHDGRDWRDGRDGRRWDRDRNGHGGSGWDRDGGGGGGTPPASTGGGSGWSPADMGTPRGTTR